MDQTQQGATVQRIVTGSSPEFTDVGLALQFGRVFRSAEFSAEALTKLPNLAPSKGERLSVAATFITKNGQHQCEELLFDVRSGSNPAANGLFFARALTNFSVEEVDLKEATVPESANLRVYKVTVLATDDAGEVTTVGTAVEFAGSVPEAEAKAFVSLWDVRLDSASCSASFNTEVVPRFVSGYWSHIFGKGSRNERECRFVYDRLTEKVSCLEILDGVRGWLAADADEVADVQNSLQQANDDALENPDNWGLDATDIQPEWVGSENAVSNAATELSCCAEPGLLANKLAALSKDEIQQIGRELGFVRAKEFCAEIFYAIIPEQVVTVAMDALQDEHERLLNAEHAR